jgi:hypothetical protein
VAGHVGKVVVWEGSDRIQWKGETCRGGLYICVLVSGGVGYNHSCLTWKHDWLGGICIGIWTAKRYRHIRKGGWGN